MKQWYLARVEVCHAPPATNRNACIFEECTPNARISETEALLSSKVYSFGRLLEYYMHIHAELCLCQ
jgi:hypothetical protein